MVGRLINGKALATSWREKVAAFVPDFTQLHGRPPGLAVILVGENPASKIYVRSKHKATNDAGMKSVEVTLDEGVSQDILVNEIERLNQDENIDGILVQLPLPDHIDGNAAINAIDPAKDVDGFHVINSGRLVVGQEALVPATPYGCLQILKQEFDDLTGLHAVIIGRSNIVGKPMAQLLLQENCTITMAHSRTKNLPDIVRSADIVVAAVGRAQMVQSEWVKDGAVVIDVGINRLPPVEEGGKSRLVGDAATNDLLPKVRAITPVPGGVGPMTIAMLLRNTLVAAYRRAGLSVPVHL